MSSPGRKSSPVKPEASRSSLRVAVVQQNAAPTVAGNVERIEASARRACRAGAEVILFPECATTGYTFDFGRLDSREMRRVLRSVGELAAGLGVHLLVGSPVSDGRRWFNGLVVFDRQGRLEHVYAKCQLTAYDRRWFAPGNALALFRLDDVPATALICHERRYPELVRIPVMAGARMIFHPNAGLDALAVSRAKRGGRDGIAVRAFENAVPYAFANTVGPQGDGKWSAGDSKIVEADGTLLRRADHRREGVVVATVDLTRATGAYAVQGREHPRFLAPFWRGILRATTRQAVTSSRRFADWFAGG